MKPAPLVTLTTDFGEADPYAAAMKGVVLARCPGARLVDLTHALPPQDLRAAALFLAGAVPHFPPGTIHVVVVDPGVGTKRRALVLHAGRQTLVCPDNGVATLLLDILPLAGAWEIRAPAFMRETVSATFHGRDVFAPAAAALATGAEPSAAGPPAGQPARLGFARPVVETAAAKGEVIHIDHFGNCITNIPRALLAFTPLRVHAGDRSPMPFRTTYGDVAPGAPLALTGSSGYVEIAVRNGHASRALGIGAGTPVRAEGPDPR